MCPTPQHQEPYIYNTFADGVSYDLYAELIPVISKSEYIEAYNMRHSSVQRSKDALEKINGEQLIYPLIDNRCIGGTGNPLANTYRCIGGESCNGYLFEIWADTIGVNAPLVRINGKIVLQSALFLADAFHYFNTHKDESVIGGIVFATDGENPPYDFNISDLLRNSGIVFSTGQTNTSTYPCTQKYFTEFQISYISQSIIAPADHPVFVELGLAADVGTGSGLNLLAGAVYQGFGSGGLAVGNYLYSISYVNTSGDQTNWSTPTPCIPVVGNLSNIASPYPYTKTYGLTVGSISQYGIHIRFRVTNLADYEFIQVLRLGYNNGYAPNTPTSLEVIAQVAILDGQIGIIDFFDAGAVAISTLPNLNIAENLSIIASANSNRFVQLRKYLGGITYESKILSGVAFTDPAGTPCYAQSVALGQIGHKEPFNAAYYKADQTGEQYAFAIELFDYTFAPFFALPVPVPSTNAGYPNGFQFPNRRDAETVVTNVTQTGSTKAALTNPTTSVGVCYEVFDLENAVTKTDTGTIHVVNPNDGNPYNPLYPTLDTDTKTNGLNFQTTSQVQQTNGGSFVDYNPAGYAPNYYATGLAIKGIENIPDTVAGFSVVRSERANRVIAQGLATWEFATTGGTSPLIGKIVNGVVFYSPDFESGIANPQEIIDGFGSGRYALQFVSPLGFFTEIFGFWSFIWEGSAWPGATWMIDMIHYARVLRENGNINVGDSATTNGVNGGDGYGYTSYGYWRNASGNSGATTLFNGGNKGNNLFTITSFAASNINRQTLYDIVIGTNNIYGNSGYITGFSSAFADTDVRQFHEPFYVANIIDTAASIPNQNQNTYFDTGTYIKTKSIIGQGNGNISQTYYLVDERVQDCSQLGSTLTVVPNRYIYIQDPLTTDISQWIDVTEFSDAQKHTVFGQIPSVYGGAYTVTQTQVGGSPLNQLNQVNFSINILATATNPFDTPTPVPVFGSLIYVYYDNTEPIVAFGGDVFIGEATYANADEVSQAGGQDHEYDTTYTGNGNVPFNFPYPYYEFGINNNYHLWNNTDGSGNAFLCTIDGVRQSILMFTAETRTCLPYDFTTVQPDFVDRNFPNSFYIMKPIVWVDANPGTYVTLPNYGDDYPEMISGTSFTSEIRYGGFRFTQNDQNTVIDYAHEANQFVYFSKAAVGFIEQNYYPTRIIWSDQKVINSQNIPGLQTFPALNFFDLSDDTGAINFLWDAQTGKYGNNLYAFTDNGICLAVTDQFVMTAGSGGELTTLQPSDGSTGVLQEIWLSKIIGLPYQMWRSKAEYNNVLFFTNNNSIYRFDGINAIDIGRQNYYSRVYGDVISQQDGMNDIGLAGYFDPVHKEASFTTKQTTLNINTDDLINAGINDNYSYYNITIPLIGEPETPVDVNMGAIFYVTNNCGVPLLLVDSTTGFSIYAIPNGATVQVIFGGQTNYTVNPINTDYSYNVTVRLGTSGQLDYLFFNGTEYAITGTYSNIPALLNLLITNYSFSGAVNWVINQNIVTGITTGVLGTMLIQSGGIPQEIHPAIDIELPFTAITFNYFDTSVVPQKESQNEAIQASWNGYNIYDYDKYVVVQNQLYGIKSGGTYLVGGAADGYIFNGEPITASVLQAFNGDQNAQLAKEFIRLRVNSDNSPTEVDFYDNLSEYRADNIQSQCIGNFVQRYGTECYVPRRITLSGQRMQGRYIVYNVINSNNESFVIANIGVQHKVLK